MRTQLVDKLATSLVLKFSRAAVAKNGLYGKCFVSRNSSCSSLLGEMASGAS